MTFPEDTTNKTERPYVWLWNTGRWRDDALQGRGWHPDHYVSCDFDNRMNNFYGLAGITQQQVHNKNEQIQQFIRSRKGGTGGVISANNGGNSGGGSRGDGGGGGGGGGGSGKQPKQSKTTSKRK